MNNRSERRTHPNRGVSYSGIRPTVSKNKQKSSEDPITQEKIKID